MVPEQFCLQLGLKPTVSYGGEPCFLQSWIYRITDISYGLHALHQV